MAKVIPLHGHGESAQRARAAKSHPSQISESDLIAGRQASQSRVERDADQQPSDDVAGYPSNLIQFDSSQGSASDAEAAPARTMAGVGVAPSVGGTSAGATGGTLEGRLDGVAHKFVHQVADKAAFLRRRVTGDYQVDDFGFDPDLNETVLLPLLRPLFEKWFRVVVNGVENIPNVGGALVVANHAGVIPLDGLMTAIAVHDQHPTKRALRMLVADMAFEIPVIGTMARKAGHTLACNPDAERLLRTGEVAAVFPEGFKGIGKPFADRYKLQRFGRGGFVSAALKTGAPIIPCSIVGSEEIYPKIGDIKSLARLLGFPYFPVTPFFPLLGPLGIVPLPSKWYIEFGEPIYTKSFGPAAAEDPMIVFDLTDQVRENIQQTLYRLLAKRRNVFLG